MMKTAIFEFTARIKACYGVAGIEAWLDKARTVSCCVVGDYIRDEYILVMPRGTTQGIRTWQDMGVNTWAGGADLIGAHLSSLTQGGLLISRNGAIKRRYITADGRKLFSAATVIVRADRQEIPAELPPCVIAADYGHMALMPEDIPAVSQGFLALTVQANSLNCKANTLRKWPRADYVLVNEEEMRLTSENGGELLTLMRAEAARLGCKYLVVTRGSLGCVTYQNGMSIGWPALADKVVDTMGAGDCFLAVTAPLAYLDAPIDLIAFVGSVAAGIHCGKRGNPPLAKGELLAKVKELLT